MRTWQRMEHRWETRKRAEQDKTAVLADELLSEAQIQEERRDAEAFWKAYVRRLESPDGYTSFETISRALAVKSGVASIDIDFFELFQRMKDGRPVDTDAFVIYLERDPWERRSGQTKERVIQFLKKVELTEPQCARLRQVILHVVDMRYRREFRDFCRLARVVDAPELRRALFERFCGADGDVRRRAAWVLFALGEREPNLTAWQR